MMGVLSGLFVVTANAWMNTPTGFTLDAAGAVIDVDPFAAMPPGTEVGTVAAALLRNNFV